MELNNIRIKSKIDTTENWQMNNPILLEREIGIEKISDDSIKIKIGDGATTWNSLGYIDFGSDILPISTSIQTTTTWNEQSTSSGTSYYQQVVTIPNLTTSMMVDISLDADGLAQLLNDGVTAIWAENNNGTCTLKTLGAAPTTILTLYLTLIEVSN